MYRVINEYLNKIDLQDNEDIYKKLYSCGKDIPGVGECTVTVHFKRYIVDIRLKKYSVDKAAKVFNQFNEEVSYPYSSMYVRFNEGSCVRYRYITSKEDKKGFYCDIVIS
ncbi:MAG: hypothetical protein IJX12_02470 [Lachnospiraceae bacterium]|nr:hypothetical protein [Lachnospiraceae bacterium]